LAIFAILSPIINNRKRLPKDKENKRGGKNYGQSFVHSTTFVHCIVRRRAKFSLKRRLSTQTPRRDVELFSRRWFELAVKQPL
jgi:hypothetical protein